jgi:putative FmdB family regulatory protein
MPIYAFQCQACGHHFDRLQKLSDADPTDCPVCAQASVTRKLTAPSFRLAGGGWYETDFKKDGKRNLAEKGDAGGASKPTEAAPAKAAEPAPAKPATPAKSAD